MNNRLRRTLEAIRAKPERGDIAWSAVEALLLALGCRKLEGDGSRVRFVSADGAILRIHRPHPRPVLDKGAVKSVRRFLSEMEIEQ
ncbi:type II toxin-antitoxin system HicA family toxin [Desulfolutivibrio sp.]|uniref:type II toxin-antitoxin system HicA family toxin n=1 Tax=Desulfolutivibrio sp. TaxID=2773296 RepID=UPI002F96E1FC